MLRNVHIWFGEYIKQNVLNKIQKRYPRVRPHHLLFTICDHFEPYWENNNDTVAYNRVKKWVDQYQPIASNHKTVWAFLLNIVSFFRLKNIKNNTWI